MVSGAVTLLYVSITAVSMNCLYHHAIFQVIKNNLVSARKTGRPKYDVIFHQRLTSVYLRSNASQKFDNVATYDIKMQWNTVSYLALFKLFFTDSGGRGR